MNRFFSYPLALQRLTLIAGHQLVSLYASKRTFGQLLKQPWQDNESVLVRAIRRKAQYDVSVYTCSNIDRHGAGKEMAIANMRSYLDAVALQADIKITAKARKGTMDACQPGMVKQLFALASAMYNPCRPSLTGAFEFGELITVVRLLFVNRMMLTDTCPPPKIAEILTFLSQMPEADLKHYIRSGYHDLALDYLELVTGEKGEIYLNPDFFATHFVRDHTFAADVVRQTKYRPLSELITRSYATQATFQTVALTNDLSCPHRTY